MMEPLVTILGGVVIAVVSAGATKFISGKNHVTTRECSERREAEDRLLEVKFAGVEDKIDALHNYVKDWRRNGREESA